MAPPHRTKSRWLKESRENQVPVSRSGEAACGRGLLPVRPPRLPVEAELLPLDQGVITFPKRLITMPKSVITMVRYPHLPRRVVEVQAPINALIRPLLLFHRLNHRPLIALTGP